jgi:multiple sugar transport system substrate-binding protein
MRTKSITATLSVLALGLTAACGGDDGGGEASGADQRGPIKIWLSNNPEEIAWGKAMVEEWNAENPDEEITAQEIPAGQSSEEVIGAAITAGNAPCLVFNTSPAAVPQFQKQGGLVALDGFEGGAEYVEERSGDTAAQYQSPDGQYYQMPWKSNPVMIFYNKALMKKAGVDPENPPLATHEEFLETSRKIVDSGAAQAAIWPAPSSEFFQSWFDFYPLFAAETGGTQLVEDGEATFNSEEGNAVAEVWATMYDEGLAQKEAYNGDSFADQKAAMAIVGPWAIATSEEQDGKLLEMTGQMPLRQDLPGTYPDYFKEKPEYEAFADQAARTVEVPNVPNSIEIWQAFRDAWSESVIFGKTPVEDALGSAADEVTSLAGQG